MSAGALVLPDLGDARRLALRPPAVAVVAAVVRDVGGAGVGRRDAPQRGGTRARPAGGGRRGRRPTGRRRRRAAGRGRRRRGGRAAARVVLDQRVGLATEGQGEVRRAGERHVVHDRGLGGAAGRDRQRRRQLERHVVEVAQVAAPVRSGVLAGGHHPGPVALVRGVAGRGDRIVQLQLGACRDGQGRAVGDPPLRVDRGVVVAQRVVPQLYGHVEELGRHGALGLYVAVRRGGLELVEQQRGQRRTHEVLVLRAVEAVVAGHLPEHDAADALAHHVVGLGTDGLLVLSGQEDLLLVVPQPRRDQGAGVVTDVRAGQPVSRVGRRGQAVRGEVVAGAPGLQVLGVPHRVGPRGLLATVRARVVPQVVDADGAVSTRDGRADGTAGAGRALALVRQRGPAPQAVGA